MQVVGSQTLENFLADIPFELRGLVHQTRALILAVMPETIEQLDPSIRMIAYGVDRSYKGLICSITIFKSYINIMLAQGASLPDPDGLLKGTGKLARHIRIEKSSELENPGVRAMLETAHQFHRQSFGENQSHPNRLPR